MSAPNPSFDARSDPAPIGGFFERCEPDGVVGTSVLTSWTSGRPHAAFVNARSAFAALAAMFPQATVWLPAFLCADMAQPAYADRTRFYPVRDGFEPDLDPVCAHAAPGDIVLVVAYFGLPLSRGARTALARRPDLRIVEDRAQALEAGRGLGRGWRLYSPRKLLGVADGGVLVCDETEAVVPQPTARADADALWAAPNARWEDSQGRHNRAWHAANQAKEASMAVTGEAMTDLSMSILGATSQARLADARWANWRALDVNLRTWSALPADPKAAPLGYVLRLAPAVRDRLLAGLHAERIFAAVHWPRIAAPAGEFQREAAWSRELVTLPCDHRYGASEAQRIAHCVRALIA